MAGARWVQKDLLAANPDAELEVLAVWFNMYQGDDRSQWPAQLLTDPRVVHYWDRDQILGRYYAEHVTDRRMGDIEWDAYFLYSPDSRGEEALPAAIVSGAPIVHNTEQLEEALNERVFR